MAQNDFKTAVKSKDGKELSIETLRGIAIILVVAGYIIKDDLGRGSDSSIFSSGLHFINYCFTPIRMPLFTVISAYLYAFSPATRASLKKLVSGKARRIMIPFAVISAAQYLVYYFVPVNGQLPLHEIYKVYILPYEQLWFLYSIFWIFIIVGAMDAARLMDTYRKWAVCLGLSLILHVTVHPTRFLSMNGVNYLFPFFLMGYGIKRFSDRLFTNRMICIYLIGASVAYAAYTGLYFEGWIGSFVPAVLQPYIVLAVTFSIVPLIFHFRKTVPILAKVGSYAFGIHLFNKIGLVPIKVLFLNLGIRNDVIIFTAYLAGSVFISIAIQLFLERFNFARTYVLGLKPLAPVDAAPVRRKPALQYLTAHHFSWVVVIGVLGMLMLSQGSVAVSSWDRFMCERVGVCMSMRAGKACTANCSNCRSGCHTGAMKHD